MLTAFSIVVSLGFVVLWGLLLWKGPSFLRWTLWHKLAAAFSVVAVFVVWIAWGRYVHDKNEATMMYVCWDSQGHAQYPKGSEVKSTECANPEKFNWPGFPKDVYFDSEHGRFDDYKSSFHLALHFWNSEVGEHIFTEVASPEEADIVVHFGPVDGPESGATRHTKLPSGAIKVDIALTRPDNINVEYNIMCHELGHALGLAHDDEGIMVPVVQSDVMYLVTEPDKKAIRSMLGQ